MLAKNWKRIGLIILIVACFANITAKFVKKVSFNENVKSTITNAIDNVDETVQNTVNSVKSEFTNDNKTNEEPKETNVTQTQSQNEQTVESQNNTFVIEENTNTTN